MFKWLATTLFGGREAVDEEWWGRWRPAKVERSTDWSILREVTIRGTRHRKARCLAFIIAFKEADRRGAPYGIEVEREPDNPADRNAIAVYGVLGPERHQLGYVPADVAAEIAADFPPDMPLAADLKEISTLGLRPEERVRADTTFGIFINVLRPSKRSSWWKANMKAEG